MSSIYSYSSVDEIQFERLVADLAPQHIPIEQTPAWGRFDDALKERHYLGSFRYDEDGKLVALASATLYRQKGRDWIWIKHGPIFAHEPNTETLKKMCSTLKAQFSSVDRVRPIFIRMSSPDKIAPLRLPFEHTMYDETVVVDLTKTDDEILAEMSQSGRQGVRKAAKANVSINEVEPDDMIKEFQSRLYPILDETAKRGGFGIHPLGLYEAMLKTLQPYARLYVANVDSRPQAWAITTEYNKTALYYYGASSAEARDSFAPYLLHREIIKAMKARGNNTYDFMGIAGKNYPSLANVTTFKLKFSKDIKKVPQAYDLPLQSLKYRALSLAIKTKRKLR